MQAHCLGPGAVGMQDGGQPRGQGDQVRDEVMASGVVDGRQQVGALGAQPDPRGCDVRQRRDISGRGTAGPGSRGHCGEGGGAAGGVLVVVIQAGACRLALVAGVRGGQGPGVGAQQVVHPVTARGRGLQQTATKCPVSSAGRPQWMRDGMQAVQPDGADDLAVVGESRYRRNLWRLAGQKPGGERVHLEMTALLVAEARAKRLSPRTLANGCHAILTFTAQFAQWPISSGSAQRPC